MSNFRAMELRPSWLPALQYVLPEGWNLIHAFAHVWSSVLANMYDCPIMWGVRLMSLSILKYVMEQILSAMKIKIPDWNLCSRGKRLLRVLATVMPSTQSWFMESKATWKAMPNLHASGFPSLCSRQCFFHTSCTCKYEHACGRPDLQQFTLRDDILTLVILVIVSAILKVIT